VRGVPTPSPAGRGPGGLGPLAAASRRFLSPDVLTEQHLAHTPQLSTLVTAAAQLMRQLSLVE